MFYMKSSSKGYTFICATTPIWGVDTAATVTQEFYQCVVDTFGKPGFWGRYLTGRDAVDDPISLDEVTFLHSKGIKVLLVYNEFKKALGKDEGVQIAQKATSRAKELKLPLGKVIFADIEPDFSIDADWIIGWACTVVKEGYKPGIYGSPEYKEFSDAYCTALKDECVQKNIILYSDQPRLKPTPAKSAPAFKPSKTSCNSSALAYQYGVDAVVCPERSWEKLDTSLIDPKLMNDLW